MEQIAPPSLKSRASLKLFLLWWARPLHVKRWCLCFCLFHHRSHLTQVWHKQSIGNSTLTVPRFVFLFLYLSHFVTVTSDCDACCSMRNVKLILVFFFQTMRSPCVMFVTAVCILFLVEFGSSRLLLPSSSFKRFGNPSSNSNIFYCNFFIV